jgi:aminoglycoside 6-adenylyltransferase
MDELERKLVAWAQQRDDIRAAIVVGSRARTDHPADDWADLDIALATTQPNRYHADTSWIAEIAPVWTMYKDPSGVTYHVLFEGGLDAGIAIIPMTPVRLATRVLPTLQRYPAISRALPFGLGKGLRRQVDEASEYYRRGVKVLLDRDGTAEKFLSLFPSRSTKHKLPSERQFQQAIDEFWFAVVWTAKHLWRGEIWHARATGNEGRMRDLLLQMIEWHAWSMHGVGYETWNDGRFLEEWADPRVLAHLPDALPSYNRASVQRGLIETADLFAWLSEETAENFGLSYSPGLAETVRRWIGEHTPA